MNRLVDDPYAEHFDELFRLDADPWRTRTRWYERRKRALTLASLPCERYKRAFEPGCGAGELTAELALRCDQVIASDASMVAVQRACRRLMAAGNVQLRLARVPHDWPDEQFDLVLVSELGYYLSTDDLERFAHACRASLADDGSLLACHWRRAEPDMLRDAAQVHAALQRHSGLHLVSHYEDGDLLLDVWSSDPTSVAQREELA